MAAGMVGCGDDPVDTPVPEPQAAAVDAMGPYGVGYRSLPVTYTSPAGERSFVLHIWYPTEEPSGDNPSYLGVFLDDASFVDAPLGRSAYDRFPVLVHSHGHMGFGGNSAFIMRHFASHGWVALAPDHTDNTLADAVEPRPTRHFYERPLDIRQSLDTLDGLAPPDPLAGATDTSRVIMTGHSFGTYTAWASAGAAFDTAAIDDACANGGLPSGMCSDADKAAFMTDLSEPRVAVAVPMAGGTRDELFGATGYDAVTVPVLLMTGSEDDVGAQALFDRLDPSVDMRWVDMAGGCHQLFGLGGCANLPDAEGQPLVNGYVLAYARHFVLGDEADDVMARVNGPPVDPAVTEMRK